MWYHRGTAGSYQLWADQVGDDSYSFENFLPYFKRSVDWTPPATTAPNVTIRYNTSTFFPSGGPLQLSYSTYTYPLFTWFSKVLNQIGLPLANDFSGGSLNGYKYIETTIDPETHLRSSSESSFLQAASTRSNLHVLTSSIAEKIHIDQRNRACGVIVNGTTIKATREVILSAGTFQSPQLLMLSGIGPRAELERHQISVIVDLPGVGQNMWDHIMFGPTTIVNIPTAQTNSSSAEALDLWKKNRTGPLTSTNADAVGFSRFNDTAFATLSQETQQELSKFPEDWPELEYLPQSGFVGNQSGDTAPPSSANYAAFVMGLVKPLSRGAVTLNSSSPFDPPIIDPKWLTHPADQESAIAAFKVARQILHSSAMQPVLADPDVPEVYPGPEVSTDEAILEFARDNIATIWHAAATCKMGNANDELAVVDSKAKVRGISGLRIVDASAFPFLPPGHPQSTVYALAEKISDEILKDAEEVHCEL
jgi:choline dehydrogenase